jgi:hypothetical protein
MRSPRTWHAGQLALVWGVGLLALWISYRPFKTGSDGESWAALGVLTAIGLFLFAVTWNWFDGQLNQRKTEEFNPKFEAIELPQGVPARLGRESINQGPARLTRRIAARGAAGLVAAWTLFAMLGVPASRSDPYSAALYRAALGWALTAVLLNRFAHALLRAKVSWRSRSLTSFVGGTLGHLYVWSSYPAFDLYLTSSPESRAIASAIGIGLMTAVVFQCLVILCARPGRFLDTTSDGVVREE